VGDNVRDPLPLADTPYARRLLTVIGEADGGCHACVEALCRELVRTFPGDWLSVIPEGDDDGYWGNFDVDDWRQWLRPEGTVDG